MDRSRACLLPRRKSSAGSDELRSGEGHHVRLAQRALFQQAEVSREEDVREAIDAALREFGRLDCIFNNAGFGGALGPIAETPTDEFDLTFAVLVRGVFLGMKYAAPVMLGQGSGCMINTASVAGLRAGFGPHAYSAAKAAVIQLTRSVAMELAEGGVRVNCICPVVDGGLMAGRRWSEQPGFTRRYRPIRVYRPEDA